MVIGTCWPRSFNTLLVLFSPLTFLTGCEKKAFVPEDVYQYAIEVEETLELDSVKPKQAVLLPARAERMLDIEPITVSFGQWYQLEECEAGNLIAQANNSLGKVRSAFEKLRHSRDLLLSMDGCKDAMGEKAWNDLRPSIEKKADQFDEQRWNAVWLSEAVQSSFGRTAPLQTALQSNAPEYWSTLLRTVSPPSDEPIRSEDWYAAESALHRSAAVGEAIRFMILTTDSLERVVGAIEQSEAERTNCLRKDRRVVALMRGHYANRIQPLMALGDPTLRATSEVMDQAVKSLIPSSELSPSMKSWMALWSDQTVFQAYREAIRRHAQAIGGILKRCDMSL